MKQDRCVLIVLRGLQGSGKSSIAGALGRRLNASVLSVDPIEAAIWRAGIRRSYETGVAAYEVAAAIATEQLRLGHDVVVDAVNAYVVIREMWKRVARCGGAPMAVIEVVCSDRDVHRRRLDERVRDIDGLPEPTWEEVEEKRADWEAWPDRRLLLDSVDPLDVNVERALQHINSPSL